MNYPIPATQQDIVALLQQPVTEESVAVAIAGTIALFRAQGKSLAELTAEILEEDPMLDRAQRHWLSQVLAQAWELLP